MEKEPSILFPELAEELKRMRAIDQEFRIAAMKGEREWDDSIDKAHAQRLKEIIAAIGWPTASKVGAEGSDNAWLLVQHADHDIGFQKECLELMRREPEGEVLPRNIAYLEDRILTHEGKPQTYGTQFRVQDEGGTDEYIPFEIREPEKLNERRKAMGMETFEENVEALKERNRGLKEENE